MAGLQWFSDIPLNFRKLETMYLPHLPPITTADEILSRLLEPGTKAAEQLRHFHIWLQSLNLDNPSPGDLEELKSRLPAIYVELEAPKGIVSFFTAVDITSRACLQVSPGRCFVEHRGIK